jgi:hypothetical protein
LSAVSAVKLYVSQVHLTRNRVDRGRHRVERDAAIAAHQDRGSPNRARGVGANGIDLEHVVDIGGARVAEHAQAIT